MAKAKRVHSTPRQTAQKPVTRDEPMKAPGCHWEFWNGAIGLSTDLSVFEAGDEVGTASNLPDSERIALANYMIDLWTQVRDQHHNAPNETSVDGDVQAGRESLARLSLDIEEDVMNLCRAVKVVSSVITDQLADPLSGPPVISDYGLEVQTFQVDASMVRFAVDHATDIALDVSRKMV
jgi:hypothetical protein